MSVITIFNWDKSILPLEIQKENINVQGIVFPIKQQNPSYADVMMRLWSSLQELNVLNSKDCMISIYCDLYIQSPKLQNVIHIVPKKIINTETSDDFLHLKVQVEIYKNETKPHFYSAVPGMDNNQEFKMWSTLFM